MTFGEHESGAERGKCEDAAVVEALFDGKLEERALRETVSPGLLGELVSEHAGQPDANRSAAGGALA